MLSIKSLTKYFDDKLVIDNISFSVNFGDLVALIGDNGSGKSTLLNILASKESADAGKVDLTNEYIGYVPQIIADQHMSVENYFTGIDSWRIDYALQIVELENVRSKIINQLSSGQHTRLLIAQTLATNPTPTILLLDEPTNNIDRGGIDWLINFTRNFDGAVIFASHDRSFINQVAKQILELHDGKITNYGGNYDFYKQQKQLETQNQIKQYEENITEKKKLNNVLKKKQERARKGLRSHKMQDNDKAQFDWHQNNVQRSFSGQVRALKSRVDQLEDVEKPKLDKNYRIKIVTKHNNRRKLICLHDVSKNYENLNVLENISLTVQRGERWHIRGKNGSGKSTLLKIIAGKLSPQSGSIDKPDDLAIGYFSHELDKLDTNEAAIDYLNKTNAKTSDIFRQSISMGLTHQQLHMRVSQLSRGQVSKLIFTELLLGNHDALILDEPTNHLDINTKDRLEAALRNLDSALIVTSHDQYFIDEIGITNTLDI